MIETISDYKSAKDFVSAWIDFKKSKRTGFSMRRLCRLLDLKSPNYLALVLEGKRALTVELGQRLAKQMGLSAAEHLYFMSLIEAAVSSAGAEDTLLDRKVLRARRHLKTEALAEECRELVSRWQHVLIRELTLLPDFKFSAEYVRKKLCDCVSLAGAQQSLDLLSRQGLIELKSIEGRERWVSTDQVLDTGNETFDRSSMLEHHAATLKVWSENLGRLNPSEQELGLLNIPIASEKIPELRKRIQCFQDELIGWLMNEKNPDRVVQVGTYLIPFNRD